MNTCHPRSRMVRARAFVCERPHGGGGGLSDGVRRGVSLSLRLGVSVLLLSWP